MSVVSGRGIVRIALFLIATALGAASPALAQGGASAAVTGSVTDAQGGVLPGVTVTLRNVETGNVRTTVTEADGRYGFPGLLPGRYALTAEPAAARGAGLPAGGAPFGARRFTAKLERDWSDSSTRVRAA